MHFGRITAKTTTTTMMTAIIAAIAPMMIGCKYGAGAVTVELVNTCGDTVPVLILVVVRVVDREHIDPDESLNMSSWSAFEWTQATPQRAWLKDVAP